MFLETSALTGENVEEAFLKCARTILNKIESGASLLPVGGTLGLEKAVFHEMALSVGALLYSYLAIQVQGVFWNSGGTGKNR